MRLRADGKPIPTELKGEEAALREQASLEDVRTAALTTHVDDEYARAGEEDPRILLTTSRNPSTRLTAFAKELKLVFPNTTRLNRGAQVMGELVESCRTGGYSDIVIVHEHRGEPDGLVVCHLPFGALPLTLYLPPLSLTPLALSLTRSVGPTAYFGLMNCVARHDIKDTQLGTVSEAYPHIILEGFSSALGTRVNNILKHLFPVPKDDTCALAAAVCAQKRRSGEADAMRAVRARAGRAQQARGHLCQPGGLHLLPAPHVRPAARRQEHHTQGGASLRHAMPSVALPLSLASPALPRSGRASRCGCIRSSWARWSSKRRRWSGRCGHTCAPARSASSERTASAEQQQQRRTRNN
jgi:rRNA maturation protein Rpf1